MAREYLIIVRWWFQSVSTWWTSALAAWKNGTPPAELNTKDWSTHEWLRFIKSLPDEITADQMTALDQAFHLPEPATASSRCLV